MPKQARLDAAPELAALFDRFDSLVGQEALVRLAERIRIDEAIFNQAWIRNLHGEIERSAQRYLELAKAALLDEHYLDNEVRLEYLLTLVDRDAVDPDALRDPARFLPVRFQRDSRRCGPPGSACDEGRTPAYFPYTEMGRAQLDQLEAALLTIRTEEIPGDLAEIGTGRGGGAVFLRAFLAAHEMTDRTVWVADSFLATADESTGG